VIINFRILILILGFKDYKRNSISLAPHLSCHAEKEFADIHFFTGADTGFK